MTPPAINDMAYTKVAQLLLDTGTVVARRGVYPAMAASRLRWWALSGIGNSQHSSNQRWR